MPTGKRILFLNWKDIKNPSAGGAEALTDAFASELAKTNDVTYITSSFPEASSEEYVNGYRILRKGTTKTTVLHAFFMQKALQKKYSFDLIIDQVHGIPFFSIWYKSHPSVAVLIHEIAGTLWKNILPAPLGLFVDTIWLWLYKNQKFITISLSTKQELISHHIPSNHISLVPVFSDFRPNTIPEKPDTTILILGRIAPVKRIEHGILAFKLLQKEFPKLRLVIVGKSEQAYEAYNKHIHMLAHNNAAISILENVSEEEKNTWLKRSRICLMPSEKEGFGIAIIEAASYGAPSIGYSVPGVQDAITDGETGLLAKEQTPAALAQCMRILLTDTDLYRKMQYNAFKQSNKYTKENSLRLFTSALES